MRPPVVGFRHPSFRRCKYFAPYRGDIKPPLEVVVMTSEAFLLRMSSHLWNFFATTGDIFSSGELYDMARILKIDEFADIADVVFSMRNTI